jgi:SAM-dependent methyltransferase
VVTVENEERELRRALSALGASDRGTRILDVGCGYGRLLRLVRSLGGEAVGVEANAALRAAVAAAGFACLSPEECAARGGEYDVLLMAHIIEHFPPGELLVFMERYLDRLRPGGHLVIATPLMSPYFYDDFDHVKPYHPAGLGMVFGAGAAQVQYYARHRLELTHLWFRRAPLRRHWSVKRHLRRRGLHLYGELLLALLFRLSGGLIGRTDGWVGVYRKLEAPPSAPTAPGTPRA